MHSPVGLLIRCRCAVVLAAACLSAQPPMRGSSLFPALVGEVPAVASVAAQAGGAGAASSPSASALPRIEKRNGVAQFIVDGQPFLMLSGELHNSSASSVEYMKPIWPRLAALHLNTVIGTVSWELTEPVEGQFDFSLIDAQIHEARQHHLRLVLIWFASWKNASSSYVPMWVKTDPKRFPRREMRADAEVHPFVNDDQETLSPFGEASLAADAKAFRMVMRHIREVDPQHTVVLMQVENESGMLGDSRDRSVLAEAAWKAPVPSVLMTYLVRNKETLLPELKAVWERNGFKEKGTWAEVFGNDELADEVFMAWAIGRYINHVAAEGKAELALPMYVNAWLGPQPGQLNPGQYPSGGPVARVMDVWRAAGPSLDLFAPDIYVEDFKGVCAEYTRSGNPLFIPEARAMAGNLFWAIGQHRALGVSPFGIDDLPSTHQLGQAYGVAQEMMPLITQAQAESRIAGVLVQGDQPETLHLAGYTLTAGSVRRFPWLLAAGQQAMETDSPEKKPASHPFGPPPLDARPFGLVIAMGQDEFWVVGSGLTLTFTPETPGPKHVGLGWIEEGRFERGQWTAGRRLNGDEAHIALPTGPVGVLRVKLYRYD